MRLRRTLALAAVATAALSLAVPTLLHSGPHHPLHAVAATRSASSQSDPAATWTWPLTPPQGARRPVVVHPFAPPAKRWESGHRGVDLLGGPGQEVLAAGQGVVSYAGVLVGRAVIAIDHTPPGRGTGDTLRTTYEPVDPVVKVGDKVRVGQVIGHLVDSPASHCAPQTCLHWGLVRGFGHAARYLDPSLLVQRHPVRLLPVWGVR
jgi:murein DD-endopeptidase MepM/ murein hydrolase activator NlpD